MSRVLLTGASGFVGSAVLGRLQAGTQHSVSAVQRRSTSHAPDSVHLVPTLDADTDWSAALTGCDVVIHAAARVHVMNEHAIDPLAAFREVNVDGTLNFARQAFRAGVKRFIFISSVKVLGESTPLGSPFRADSVTKPEDAYGLSKAEAERGLLALAAASEMDVVIIRPPLVYGAGVKGNFAALCRILSKGYPLPLGSIENKRSLVGLDNLVDLIVHCIDHPAAGNQIFLASDNEDISTTDLLRRAGSAMGKTARLIPVPPSVLELSASLLGRRAVAQRLLGSLQVDISKTLEMLNWTPPVSLDEGLRRCFKGKGEL